jgi:serine/threonine protein kinase
LAPEILEGNPYTGSAVDIFNAGIILFMMVTQTRPFGRPAKSDSFYKPLIENRPDLFWKLHAKNEEITE